MAAAAGGIRYLAVENAVSERDLLFGKALRNGKFSRVLAGVGMDALRRPSISRVGRLRRALGGRRSRDRGSEVALIGDAPNPSVHIVRDKQRAVWSNGQTRRPERCTARIFHGPGKAIGKHDKGSVC